MKKCLNCNTIVDESAGFCPKCGAELPASETAATTVISQNDNNIDQSASDSLNSYLSPNPNGINSYYAANQNQTMPNNYQPYSSQKKGLKPIHIVLIVIGAVLATIILLAIIGSVSENSSEDIGTVDNYVATYDDDQDESNDTKVEEYSKGRLEGSTYINEWADIKFIMPNGFSNATSSIYSSAEDYKTDCGMYFMADDSKSVIYICYEKLYSDLDEEKYLDSVMKQLDSQSTASVKFHTTNKYTTYTIAGYAYAKAEYDLSNANGDFAGTFYVRKQGDYMIGISVMGVSHESNDSLASKINRAD